MQNYDINYQTSMSGTTHQIVENITAIFFDSENFMFWYGKNCMFLIEKEYVINFYPAVINYNV